MKQKRFVANENVCCDSPTLPFPEGKFPIPSTVASTMLFGSIDFIPEISSHPLNKRGSLYLDQLLQIMQGHERYFINI